MIERPALKQLEELKWLRGGVLAVHAMLGAVESLDDQARRRVDWSALAYLTDQMQHAVLEGAFASYLDKLEQLPTEQRVTELIDQLRASLDRADRVTPGPQTPSSPQSDRAGAR
jgi:hypothetical protein